MNNREQCRADRVDRVLVFGDENAADFVATRQNLACQPTTC